MALFGPSDKELKQDARKEYDKAVGLKEIPVKSMPIACESDCELVHTWISYSLMGQQKQKSTTKP